MLQIGKIENVLPSTPQKKKSISSFVLSTHFFSSFYLTFVLPSTKYIQLSFKCKTGHICLLRELVREMSVYTLDTTNFYFFL